MHAVWLLRRTKPFGTIVLLAAHTPHNVHTKFHSADICDILSMNIWAINVVLNVKFRKPSSPSPYALLRMIVCRKPRYDVQILSCVDILPVQNNSEACGDVYRWCMPSSELDRNCVSRGRHTQTHTYRDRRRCSSAPPKLSWHFALFAAAALQLFSQTLLRCSSSMCQNHIH